MTSKRDIQVVLLLQPMPVGWRSAPAALSVGLQSGRDGLERGEETDEAVRFEATISAVFKADGLDFSGPLVHGKRGDRFMYVSWGRAEGPHGHAGFRRLKVYLSPVTRAGWSSPGLTEELVNAGGAWIAVNGVLADGTPNCGTAHAVWEPA